MKRMRRRKHSKPDPLSVQVSIKARVPKGTKPGKRLLNEAFLQWVKTGDLPRGWEIRGIFWRNGARPGKLSYWRYAEPMTSAVYPTPIEDSPRGSIENARDSLKEALLTLRPF